MRIQLVTPARYDGYPIVRSTEGAWMSRHDVVPVWEFGYFASALEARSDLDVELRHIDGNAEDLSNEEILDRIAAFAPDLIVAKVGLATLTHDIEPIRRYKKSAPRAKVVLSSNLLMTIEERVLAQFPEVDGIARGELDAFAIDLATVPELERIDGVVTRGSKRLPLMDRAAHDRPRVVENLDANPIQDWDIYPDLWRDVYKAPVSLNSTGLTVISSRGCPYQCTYCTTGGNVFGSYNNWRKRSPSNVVDELQMLQGKFGVSDFVFCSDPVFTFPSHANPVSEEILHRNLDIEFSAYGRIELVQHCEPGERGHMLDLLSRAGCKLLSFGIETSDQSLANFYKRGQKLERAARAVRVTQEHGIKVAIFVMLGGPTESWKSIFNTLLFSLSLNPDFVLMNTLVPFPGTEFYEEAKREGLIEDVDSFENFEPHRNTFFGGKTVLRTKHMSPREVFWAEKLAKLVYYGMFRKNIYDHFFRRGPSHWHAPRHRVPGQRGRAGAELRELAAH